MRKTLLEYNSKQWCFHYNTGDYEPGTHGWEPIAYTFELKANLFCDAIEVILHKRKMEKREPLTAEQVKIAWRLFCYVYNRLVTSNVPDEIKQIEEANYNSFERDIKDYFSYNETSFIESNY